MHEDNDRAVPDTYVENHSASIAAEKKIDCDVDEFGRKRAEITPKPKKTREWPPCFETMGTSYVFDSRSGMFYEAESDFFYDPKSKLYYGNKKKVYYRYNPDAKKHFEQVQLHGNVDPETLSNDQEPHLDPVVEALKPKANSVTDVKSKATISITLKTKALQPVQKKSELKSMTNEQNSHNSKSEVQLVTKKQAADMEKWAERQIELRNELEKTKRPEANASTSTSTSTSTVREIAKTDKGEPICLVCRRKFPTIEKLQYHEKASTLHKENLLKQAKAENKGTVVCNKDASLASVSVQTPPPESTSSSYKYVDRAQQRRLLHGLETVPLLTEVVQTAAAATASSDVALLADQKEATVSAVHQSEPLGQSNIGNQMLQKLGWKQGTELGSSSNTNLEDVVTSGGHTSTVSIANEWDRIESIASNNGGDKVRKRNNHGSGIGAL